MPQLEKTKVFKDSLYKSVSYLPRIIYLNAKKVASKEASKVKH